MNLQLSLECRFIPCLTLRYLFIPTVRQIMFLLEVDLEHLCFEIIIIIIDFFIICIYHDFEKI